MKKIRNTGLAVLVSSLSFLQGGPMALGSEGGSGDWRTHMQELSKSLVDIFPFLYSRSEFRDPANRKRILLHLEKLSKTAHTLPEQGGQTFLGAEPLIRDARTSISSGFGQAYQLYTKKNFVESQSTAQKTVMKCFACHTANQVGPRFSAANPEVKGIATPFVQGKVFVYGALRQFSGALDFIEEQPPTIEYLKLHFILSLRGLQEFDRAAKYLAKVLPHFKSDKHATELLTQWAKDIEKWKLSPEGAAEITGSPGDERNFVSTLRESYALHRKISDRSLTSKSKAESYYRLGELYALLRVDALKGLSALYFEACRDEKPDAELLKKCSVPPEALSNQS